MLTDLRSHRRDAALRTYGDALRDARAIANAESQVIHEIAWLSARAVTAASAERLDIARWQLVQLARNRRRSQLAELQRQKQAAETEVSHAKGQVDASSGELNALVKLSERLSLTSRQGVRRKDEQNSLAWSLSLCNSRRDH